MISSKLSRVAHRAPTVASISTSSSNAVHRTSQCIAGRRSHQRRHSSSKASCPPDSSPSGGKPTPSTKASATSNDATTSEPPISDTGIQRSGKRLSRTKRPRAIAVEPEDRFAGLPSVPTTQHLHHSDISTSSFFSLHRPLSITTTFPPPSTSQAFDSLFQSQHKSDPWENGNSAERRPEDVIYTLHDTLDALESNSEANGDGTMRWEVIQDGRTGQDGVRHLDGAPMKSLDELVAQFKPFLTPPPPQVFVDDVKATSSKEKRNPKDVKSQSLAGRVGQQQRQPRQKSYSATIIVTESTSEDGRRTYTAKSSPIVRIPDPEDPSSVLEPHANNARFPFRERMRQRQQEYMICHPEKVRAPSGVRTYVRRAPVARRPKMLLISVKRQRKLKMKKHKYKKLMRRTRNLRRRLDKV